jgi:hypothetical protein
LTVAAAAVAGAALACRDPDPTEPLPLYTVTPRSPAQLAAPAGSELPQPLELEVRAPEGSLAKGVAVRFWIVTGRGATLSDTLVATNAQGIGLTRLRLGGSRDSVLVAGSVRGQEDRGVTFRVLPTAPPELLAVQPLTFASGDTVTLRGSKLTDPAGTAVFFGAARGRLVGEASDTLVRVVVPPCLTGGNVAVAVRAGSATTNSLLGVASGQPAPLTLGVGEGVVVRGTEAGCLRLTGVGQRFVVVPQFATYADTIPSNRDFALSVESAGTPVSSDEPSPGGAHVAVPTVDVRSSFEAMLRATESEIARTLGAADSATTLAPTMPRLDRGAVAAVPPPPLGSTRTFHVLSRLDGTAFTTVTAKLRYAGTNILVYEDLSAPAPLTDSVMTGLGDLFDRTLYPIDVTTFASESDIDGNGRVIVLMTPQVNALTSAVQCSAGGYVPGYFYGIDLDTRNRNSNRAEIFYAYAPDPHGERSCPHALSAVLALLPATFLHEFQHMISFNQHVLVRRSGVEAVWLNEGLSHVAEELGAQYYDERFPAPAGRSVGNVVLPDSAIPFVRGDLENAALYLANTPAHSVTAFRSTGTLEERGAAWLFLRWLGAQKGAGVYGRLDQTGLRGGANVESAANEPFAALFGDFTLSLYADSIPGLPRSFVPPRYRLGAHTLREMLFDVTGRQIYPLAPRPAAAAANTATGAMVQGTGTYYLVTVPPGGVSVRFTSGGGGPLAPGAVPQLGVLRVTP